MRRTLSAALTAVALAAGPAAAQTPSLGFTFAQNGADVTQVTAAAGQSVAVQVYLKAMNFSFFGTRDLQSVGVRVTTPGGFVSFNSVTANTGAGAFESSNTGPGPTNAAQPLQVGPNLNALVAFAATDRVLLGTFTYTAGPVGDYSIAAAAFDPAGSGQGSVANTADFLNPVAFDSSIAGLAVPFHIVPVPEPTGLLLAAGLGVLAWRRACGLGS